MCVMSGKYTDLILKRAQFAGVCHAEQALHCHLLPLRWWVSESKTGGTQNLQGSEQNYAKSASAELRRLQRVGTRPREVAERHHRAVGADAVAEAQLCKLLYDARRTCGIHTDVL